jgi:hypothetical protein
MDKLKDMASKIGGSGSSSGTTNTNTGAGAGAGAPGSDYGDKGASLYILLSLEVQSSDNHSQVSPRLRRRLATACPQTRTRR